MNQRLERLQQLAVFLQEPAKEYLKKVQLDLNVSLFVVFTWRSAIEQRQLFSGGREYEQESGIWRVVDKKKVVTNADAGTSAHNVVTEDSQPASVAMDIIPMSPDGVLLWNTKRDTWQKVWDLAWDFGFDPLGDTVGAYYEGDLGHLEEPGWKVKLAGLGLKRPLITKVEEV